MSVDAFKSKAEKSLYFLILLQLHFLNYTKEFYYALC